MIPVAGQNALVARVVEALVHETFSTSYAIVIPPCFGEDALGEAFGGELARSDRRPLVANIAIDRIATPFEYVQVLHRQWSRAANLGPPPRRGTSSTVALEELLAAVPPDRPAVQVVRRFEKFLDALDTHMLGAMRGLEASRKLHSIVCSPYPYGELKQRWAERSKKLLASSYGDGHRSEVVRPLEAADAVRVCVGFGVPEHVAQFIVEQTGGYPEPCYELVKIWSLEFARRNPPWSSEAKREFAALARGRLQRFVEHLDLPGHQEHRAAVVALHYGRGAEEPFATLDRHPWRDAILDGAELRAAALGPAAAAMLRGTQAASFETARELYASGRYREACDAIAAGQARTAPERLLRLHAEAMLLLVDPDDGLLGLDTDWKRLRKLLEEASAVATDPAARLTPESLRRIRERYGELDALAREIVDATRTGDRRIVDALASTAPRAAFWLVQLEHWRARAHARPGAATRAALALPEQVFRIWARWTLDLDEYRQPERCENLWAEVKRRWRHGDVSPAPGQAFPSFEAFAYFAFAAAEHKGIGEIGRPEPTWEALERSLSLFQIRRDHAHAVARCTLDDRRKLFDLIERWITALLPSCRMHTEAWSLSEFEFMIRPLPLLAADGELDWF